MCGLGPMMQAYDFKTMKRIRTEIPTEEFIARSMKYMKILKRLSVEMWQASQDNHELMELCDQREI